MKELLPGGSRHELYKQTLDNFARFFRRLSPMPVIFRPFHEHNGSWFWWGRGHVDEADFVAVWQFTVRYLRDEKGVHNLLYAYSPDRSGLDLSKPDLDYFYAFPGDDYVDVLGLDDYKDVRLPENDEKESFEQKQIDFVRVLTTVSKFAQARGKIPALTETGNEALKIDGWYTSVLLPALNANEDTRRMAWVQVWRNANVKVEHYEHFYAPYPGHKEAADFVAFTKDPLIYLESELPPMYVAPAGGAAAMPACEGK